MGWFSSAPERVVLVWDTTTVVTLVLIVALGQAVGQLVVRGLQHLLRREEGEQAEK